MADASYIDDELLDDPSLCEDDSEQQGLYEHFAVVAVQRFPQPAE